MLRRITSVVAPASTTARRSKNKPIVKTRRCVVLSFPALNRTNSRTGVIRGAVLQSQPLRKPPFFFMAYTQRNKLMVVGCVGLF